MMIKIEMMLRVLFIGLVLLCGTFVMLNEPANAERAHDVQIHTLFDFPRTNQGSTQYLLTSIAISALHQTQPIVPLCTFES